MKKFKIEIVKRVKLFDTVEVEASCPMEAKRVAVLLAKKQEQMEALDGVTNRIEIEGKFYPRYIWNELEGPAYPTEIVND